MNQPLLKETEDVLVVHQECQHCFVMLRNLLVVAKQYSFPEMKQHLVKAVVEVEEGVEVVEVVEAEEVVGAEEAEEFEEEFVAVAASVVVVAKGQQALQALAQHLHS